MPTSKPSTIPCEGPDNLDAMDKDDLAKWIKTTEVNRQAAAERMFGNRFATDKAIAAMLNYAAERQYAMGLRLDGRTDNAMIVEAKLDRLHANLPPYARW